VTCMKRRWLLCLLFLILVAPAMLFSMRSLGRLTFLTANTKASIYVDSKLVQGELLENRRTAVVTTRDQDIAHSYQLVVERDTDSNGDMGFVTDCNQWVAPHLPFLLETRNYPPCKNSPGTHRWPLIQKGSSMQFVLKNQTTINIGR
jgi:hypothetical protein